MTQLANPLHSATVGGLPVVFGAIVAEGAGTTGAPKIWRAANVSGDYGDARVVLYGPDGNPLLTATATALPVGTTGVLAVSPHVWDATAASYRPARSAAGQVDALGGSSNQLVAPYDFNGQTWDRHRSNTIETVIASAARTAAVVTGALTNYNGRGVQVDVNVTAKAGATTCTVQLINQGNSAVAQVAAVAMTVGTTSSVQFCPGVLAADFAAPGYGRAVAVPRTYKIQIAPSDGSSVTYSVDVQSLP